MEQIRARLRIHRSTIKVIYVSGTGDDAILRRRMLEPGTELEKPFSLQHLLGAVRRVLGTPEPVRPV